MNYLAVKRFLATGREQRRFATEEEAVAAALRWYEDENVKAVWVFDLTDDRHDPVMHMNMRDNPKETA